MNCLSNARKNAFMVLERSYTLGKPLNGLDVYSYTVTKQSILPSCSLLFHYSSYVCDVKLRTAVSSTQELDTSNLLFHPIAESELQRLDK